MSYHRPDRSSTPSDETVAMIKRILIDHCNGDNYSQMQSFLAWRYRVHAITIRRIRTQEIYAHIRATAENLDHVLDGMDEYAALARAEAICYRSPVRFILGVGRYHGYKVGAYETLYVAIGSGWWRVPKNKAITDKIAMFRRESKRQLDAGVTTV